MAFTFRTPAEEVLNRFTSDEQSRVSATALNTLVNIEKHDHSLFAFAVPEKAKEKLSTSGIYLSPFSMFTHSHPVCKILENNMLYKVVAPKLDNSFSLVSVKDSKLNILKSRDKNISMIDCINRYVTSADEFRYGSKWTVSSSKTIEGFKPKCGDVLSNVTLKNLIPGVVKVNSKKLFIHDELHYWTHKDLISFLREVTPDVLLATIVYPPEILAGSKVSLNSWCYTFDIEGNDLIFSPDGVASESYVQPVSGSYLLKTSTIRCGGGLVYHVDIVKSTFSHHLLSITKGQKVCQKYKCFSNFEAVSMKELEGLSNTIRDAYPVSFDVVSKIYMYMRSLKSPDSQSCMAKLRQLVANPTCYEIKFVEDFGKLLIKCKSITSLLLPELSVIIKFFFCSLLPDKLSRLFNVYNSKSLDSFIMNLKPFKFFVHSIEIDWDYKERTFPFFNHSESEVDPEDFVKLFDKFETGKSLEEFDRPRETYSLNPAALLFDTLIDYDDVQIESRIFGCLFEAHSNEFGIYISADVFRIRGCLMLKKSIVGGSSINLTRFAEGIEKKFKNKSKKVQSRFLLYFNNIKFKWFFCSSLRANQKFLCRRTHGMMSVELSKTMNKVFSSIKTFNRAELYNIGRFDLTSSNSDHVQLPETEDVKNVSIEHKNEFLEDDALDFIESLDSVQEIAESTSVEKKVNLSNVLIKLPDHITSKSTVKRTDENVLFGKVVDEELSNHSHFEGITELDIGVVEPTQLKGRTAFFFSRCECISYGHDKVVYKTNPWPACLNVFLEGEREYYNTCLLQVYNTSDGIPFHADDEICYIDSPVKTVNFGGGNFIFRKKQKRVDFGLQHELTLFNGQSFTMKPGFQRLFKHSVTNCQIGRVSLTFRRQDLDLQGQTIKHKCKLELEEIVFGVKISRTNRYTFSGFSVFDVPGDGDCFWHSIGALLGQSHEFLKEAAVDWTRRNKISNKSLDKQLEKGVWAERESVACVCKMLSIEIIVLVPEFGMSQVFTPDVEDYVTFFVHFSKNHYQPALPKNGCVVKALSLALNRPEASVLAVMGREENRYLLETISEGNGLGIEEIERVMEVFGLCCELVTPKGCYRLNQEGKQRVVMEMTDGHLVLADGKNSTPGRFKAQSRVTKIPNFGVSEQLKESADQIIYKPDRERASRLSESYLDGTSGVISSRLFEQQGDWLKVDDELNFKERELNLILGVYGSGKSTMFKTFVSDNPSRQIVFVSPRRELAKAIQRDVLSDKPKRKNTNSVLIKTLEAFLKIVKFTHNRAIIFDEIQLFPPGYLDLVLINLTDGNQIFLTGDPCQSKYDSASDRNIIGDMEPDIVNILNGRKYSYNVLSYRFISKIFLNRLSCVINSKGLKFDDDEYSYYNTLSDASRVPQIEFDCVLVSSFEEKKAIYSYFGRECKCHTFGESTGLTYNCGFVLISHESISASEDRWVTALSRFRRNIKFINLISDNLNDVAQMFSGRALNRFLCEKASLQDLLNMLPGNPKFVEGFRTRVGKDEGVKESKLAGDPWLKSDIFLGQSEDMEEVENQSIITAAEEFATHLSIIKPESIRAAWNEKIRMKEKRETRVGMDVSNQFTDQHSKNHGEVLSNSAERFESIYPRHNGRDSVTFLMAVRKRLKFSSPEIESKKLRIAEKYGKFLLDEFLKRVPLDPRKNKFMMDEAVKDFEEKKTSKSAAVIENHSNRSCKDWFADFALIFMKSQFCSKWDNRFRDSKAGQTLACFSHSVLCRFAPYIRYVEKKLFSAMPNNLYIHSGKGLDELEDWVKRMDFSGECTESDYEAFDASQDQYTLAFELAVMKYLQLPNDLIEDYKFIKLHLGSKLGNFAIMRFTGEASTFLFNTMANMLFTFLRYELNGKESICFAGDDMCANKRLRLKKSYESFLSKIKLKAKVCVTKHPTFCGWSLSRYGIYKKPQLVYERLCVARETNNLKNCIDSYAIEVSYGYKMGETLNLLMDQEELENHYCCVRFIIKNMHLLKSNVVNVFKNGLSRGTLVH